MVLGDMVALARLHPERDFVSHGIKRFTAQGFSLSPPRRCVFNPAPLDKHPEDPKEAAKADREMDGNFMAGLVGTFPASDPVSATQPGTRTGSPNPLWID